MKLVHRYLIVVCCLLAVCLGVAAWAYAQVGERAVNPPVVFSGADIGFRMTGRKGDMPVGELVVRVDGQWKPVQFSYGVKPLSR